MNIKRSEFKRLLEIVLLTTFTLLIFLNIKIYSNQSAPKELPFVYDVPKYKNVPEVVEDLTEPVGHKNIFFVETRSPKDGIGYFKPRQVCSIESASMLNTEWKIFVYALNVKSFKNDLYWKLIRSLPNVHIIPIDPIEFAKGSPTEKLLKEGLHTSPQWITSHTSDVLRYTILYKYAGVYMDMDVITLKSFDQLSLNFAGHQDTDEIRAGSAVVGFGDDDIGRGLAKSVAEDIGKNYVGSAWDENGLGTITRAIANLCGTIFYQNATVENCKGFKLYPTETFYSIEYPQFEMFFNEGMYDEGMKKIENSYTTHLWNYLSVNYTATKGSKTIICEVAKRLCPKTYAVDKQNCL